MPEYSTACTFAGTLIPYEQIEVVIGVGTSKRQVLGRSERSEHLRWLKRRALRSRPIAVGIRDDGAVRRGKTMK